MRKHITLIALSLAACTVAPLFLSAEGVSLPTDLSQKAKPATIKVLIEKDQKRALIEAKGNYEVYNPLNDLLIAQSYSGRRNWINPSPNGLVWGELIPGTFHIRLVPTTSHSRLLVNGIEYKGCIEIYEVGGQLHVVNEIDTERYLKSILTAEFPQELDEEVMDALAIVARTHAYYLVQRTPVTFWHVDAKEVGYNGHALTLQNLHVDRAVNNTRHMILTYHNNPFATTWTRDSAGVTTDFATIFRKYASGPKGVETPFAAYDKEKRSWSFSISKQDLAKALGAAFISEFDLYQDTASHKVYAAKWREGDTTRTIDFVGLQKALHPSKLKSNAFNMETKGNEISFRGYGEGTGVGLCLFSASALADKGEKAPKILETFFPGTQLDRVSSFPNVK